MDPFPTDPCFPEDPFAKKRKTTPVESISLGPSRNESGLCAKPDPSIQQTEELISLIHSHLECVEPHTKRFIRVILNNIKLFDKKQHDYGPMNISKFGADGVMVRLSDKIERMINLWSKGKTKETSCESMIDTWQDICNYGAIGEMCLTGAWEGYKDD